MPGAEDKIAFAGRHPERGQRGAVLVVVALLLVVLIGFSSLVFDMGQLYTVRGELQNTTDSASLAGAIMINPDNLEPARNEAKKYAAMHRSDFRRSDEIPDDDIEFGHWDGSQFLSYGTNPAPDPDLPILNAVRVRDRRAESTGNPVLLRLAPVIGHNQADVTAEAVAVGGGPAVECGFPMTVPSCSLESALEDEESCDHCFIFSPDKGATQNAAWMDVVGGNPNNPGTFGKQIRDGCPDIDDETGECIPPAGQCENEAHVGEHRDVNVGDHLNAGNKDGPCFAIRDRLIRWGDEPDGKPFIVRVPVFHESPCSGTLAGPARRITGYAAVEIFGISCGKGQGHMDPVIAPNSPDCGGATSNDKFVVGKLRCDLSSSGPPGGGYFGLETDRRVQLVK